MWQYHLTGYVMDHNMEAPVLFPTARREATEHVCITWLSMSLLIGSRVVLELPWDICSLSADLAEGRSRETPSVDTSTCRRHVSEFASAGVSECRLAGQMQAWDDKERQCRWKTSSSLGMDLGCCESVVLPESCASRVPCGETILSHEWINRGTKGLIKRHMIKVQQSGDAVQELTSV